MCISDPELPSVKPNVNLTLQGTILHQNSQLELGNLGDLELETLKVTIILDRPIAMAGLQADGMVIDWTKFPKEAIVLAIAESIEHLAVDVFGIGRDAVNRFEKVQLVSEGFAKPILQVQICASNLAVLNKLADFSKALEMYANMAFGYEIDSISWAHSPDDALLQFAKLYAEKFRKLHGGKEAQTAFRIIFEGRDFSCSGRVRPLAQKVASDAQSKIVRGKIVGWNASRFSITLKPGAAAMIELTYMPEQINWRELRNSLGENENLEFVIAEGTVDDRAILQLLSFEKIKTSLF